MYVTHYFCCFFRLHIKGGDVFWIGVPPHVLKDKQKSLFMHVFFFFSEQKPCFGWLLFYRIKFSRMRCMRSQQPKQKRFSMRPNEYISKEYRKQSKTCCPTNNICKYFTLFLILCFVMGIQRICFFFSIAIHLNKSNWVNRVWYLMAMPFA